MSVQQFAASTACVFPAQGFVMLLPGCDRVTPAMQLAAGTL
jgi:dihydroxyacid dehydratase/phosphogluconate dehydratase